ncbi:MAG: radical SAM family heme chaperone HemW [Actinomycetota bacterium]
MKTFEKVRATRVAAPEARPMGRAGRWLEDPGFGVYIHIPFCAHRCHYCDFNTYEGQQHLHAAYVEALVGDIESWTGPARRATSVFFGGGTPTLLSAASLRRVLDAVRERVGIEPGAETTVEVNPETVDAARFEELLNAGFNRFSIGVQSLVPHVLRGLGREHPVALARGALEDARRAGVEDLNADLIYGSPWESAEDWRRSLEGIVDAGPDHVSAYALTVEEGTPLATLVATGRVPDVDPDVQADRHAVADRVLASAGYRRYEVSNWSRPGAASAHNVLYWSGGDYLGFGAGAHGHRAGRRWWSIRRPRDFIAAADAGASTEEGCEVLDADGRAAEALMLGLRLVDGVELAGFASRHGAAALASRQRLIADLAHVGLLSQAEGRLALTARGTAVANDVLCRLL